MTALDVLCFSHLRWDFVYQRPQHLLTRCAQERRVFFVEEPIRVGDSCWLEVERNSAEVVVARPHLPVGLPDDLAQASERHLLNELIAQYEVHDYVLWYYTPMALAISRHLVPRAIVYDCMDELS